MRGLPVSEGVKALCRATLAEALTAGYLAEREWFEEEDSPHPLSFQNVCAVLGLSHEAVLHVLHKGATFTARQFAEVRTSCVGARGAGALGACTRDEPAMKKGTA